MHFCTDRASRSQLFNDPAGRTYATVVALLGEMAGLFEDDVLHIGCDETSVKGQCSLHSTFSFERDLARAIASKLGKRAEGWEEVYASRERLRPARCACA